MLWPAESHVLQATHPDNMAASTSMRVPPVASAHANMLERTAIHVAKDDFSPGVREVTEADQISEKLSDKGDYHDHLRDSKRYGTKFDKADMRRMGKKQELRRDFRALSALAFTVILQGRYVTQQ